MVGRAEGRQTIEFLIGRGRLELVDGQGAAESADLVFTRSERRLRTAAAGIEVGDFDGAFAAAYDGYRMAAESLLLRQGLRSAGGDGSHMTVEDAVAAQFGVQIPAFRKPTFERFRRTRHSAQYFDPSAPEIGLEDAHWALATASLAVDGVRNVEADSRLPFWG